MKKPELDDLLPIMPATVREEYIASGGAIVGMPPLVKHWLTTSTDWRVEKFVQDVKAYVAWMYRAALRRQKIMNDCAGELHANGNKVVRTRAVIDPVLKAFNKKCFTDQHAIEDTKRKEPRIFIR